MGFIPEQQIYDLKEKVDIVDLISEYVNLKRAGSSFKGLCPFHNEKTPSFMVSREKNNFHCFGCHEGGDAISFIMKIENLEYIDAVKFIAEKMGVTLEETEFSKNKISQNNKYYEINSLAARYYFKNLLTSEFAQDYLEKRGLNKKVLNKYFLGYSKNDNGLYTFLKQNGFEEKEMIDLGLVGNANGRYYDKFRDRLMFPILNNKNKVIGFGGRTLIDHNIKYINSPESEIFIKGKNIYGVNVINKSKRDKIILVEGYMDVIALYNQGVDYAVATLGTALTIDQAQMVKRYSKEIYIAYDGDEAGVKATLRAIDIFKNLDVSLGILEFPNGMDPDEYIKEFGREKFEKLIKNATDPIDYKLKKLSESSLNKMDFIKSIIEFLSTIEGNVIRDLYTDKAAKFIGVSTDSLRFDVNNQFLKIQDREKNKNKFNLQNKKSGYITNNSTNLRKEDKDIDGRRLILEKEILLYSLIDKEKYEFLRSEQDFITSENLKIIYDKLINIYQNEGFIESVFGMEEFKSLDLESEYNIVKNTNNNTDVILRELKERIYKFNLRLRLKEVKEQLESNRNDNDLLMEYTELLRKLT